MNVRHIALTCGSEENADGVFVELLGLKKSEPKMLGPALSKAIFGIDRELWVINYLDDHIHFEVFIDGRRLRPAGRLDHICLEVKDLTAFIQRSRGLNMNVIQVPKGATHLTFIRDLDGNLFEIKEIG